MPKTSQPLEEFDEDIVELNSPNLSQVSLSPSKQSNVGCTHQFKGITYEAIATQVDIKRQHEQRSESRYYCPWCKQIDLYTPKAYLACSKCVVLMHEIIG